MPYEKGQPEEEAVLQLGTGNHILVRWLNTYFSFNPEGDLTISDLDSCILFEGDELELLARLNSSGSQRQKERETKWRH